MYIYLSLCIILTLYRNFMKNLNFCNKLLVLNLIKVVYSIIILKTQLKIINSTSNMIVRLIISCI